MRSFESHNMVLNTYCLDLRSTKMPFKMFFYAGLYVSSHLFKQLVPPPILDSLPIPYNKGPERCEVESYLLGEA